MTSVNYEDIFSYFFGEVTDFKIASLEVSDAYELMREYLHKTVATPYIRRLFSSIVLSDETQVLSFEMLEEQDLEADKDFVVLVLSKGMVVQWLEPQVRSKVNLAQMFSGKEQKFFSQSAHLAELRGLLEDVSLDVRNMIRDRGYINNSYLEGN